MTETGVQLQTPLVRDFLYVDIDRVRSMLAQLAGGAPEVVRERTSKLSTLGGTVGLPPLSFQGGRNRSDEQEESRSLTDLTFVLFEESAEAVGLLSDISDEASRVDRWRSGHLQKTLLVSQLIRITAPVRLIDPVHFEASVNRIDDLVEAFAAISANEQPLQPPTSGSSKARSGKPGAREGGRKAAAITAKKQELLGSLPADALPIIGRLVAGLFRGGIWMRSLPCGPDIPDCSFAGALLDRTAYIEPERDALFSRYGVQPSEWTLVAVVSRFGATGATSGAKPLGVQRPGVSAEMDRLQLEELAAGLLAMFETVGVAEAPREPSIAVTPLALYRPLVGGTWKHPEDSL
jgi:hypothetical protein